MRRSVRCWAWEWSWRPGKGWARISPLSSSRRGRNSTPYFWRWARNKAGKSSWRAGSAGQGVEILPTWGPSKIIHQDVKVSGVELVHCTSVFDDSGAFCPVFGEEKKVLEADQVILAIGQQTDLSFLPPEGPIETIGGLIEVDLQTQKTAAGGVWAGGDAAAKGPGTPGTVIEAIAAGRRAAEAIDRALGGDGDIEESLSGESLRQGDGLPEYTGEREEGFADWSRIHVPAVPAEERSGSFVEVAQCYAEDQAVVEAGRCLQCDLEIAMIVNGSESV